MMKKIVCAAISLALCLSFAACGSEKPDASTAASGAAATSGSEAAYEAVALTQEEQSILDAMGSDVHVVSDEAYIETVAEMMYHTSEYAGQVYQLEGVLSIDGDSVQLYRTLVNGSETKTLGLPLRYLEKDIANGSWVRVTAIVAQDETEGQSSTVLDIAAIESLAEVGQAELTWDGSDIHRH